MLYWPVTLIMARIVPLAQLGCVRALAVLPDKGWGLKSPLLARDAHGSNVSG